MRERKVRVWDGEKMIYLESLKVESHNLGLIYSGDIDCEPKDVMDFTGLLDKNDKEYFFEDIGEFDNGDRFIIKCEDWLQPYIEWIGEPECQNQARDLYMIEIAKIIGNIFENPNLLK